VPTPASPVWLFDLDNTLHDASHAIFPAISANMNTYIARVLGDGVTPASEAAVNAARLGYLKRYGATLLGMIRHHRVDAADFLRETHDIGALHEMVRHERGLKRLLRRPPSTRPASCATSGCSATSRTTSRSRTCTCTAGCVRSRPS
jgi:putative hydrolase of the HAD superfamily